MARILDTSEAFVDYAKGAFLDNPVLREQQWRDRYEGAHPDVFRAFYAEQPSTEGRKALIRELSALRARVEEAVPATKQVVEEIDPALREVLGLPAEPSPLHVLVVGPSSTNAVVGRLGDDVALFHCLEWFRSPESARTLVAHEGTHAWHEIALGERPPQDDAAWMAFSEGVAVQASRTVVPGRPDDDYFWFGYEGFEDWLGWCRERRDELLERFRSAIDDPDTVEVFFGGGLVEGHWRVGYFVADEVVSRLGTSLPELVGMTVERAREAVRSALGG